MIELGEVCNFQGGSQPPKNVWINNPKDGYIPMLQIRDFTQSPQNEYVPTSNSLKICKEDDILIARYGASVGKILTGLSGAYNVAIVKTIPDAKSLIKPYLYFYLKSDLFQNLLKSVGSRAAQQGFNKEDITKFKIPLPPLSEQKRIAAILDKADAIRRKRKQALELADEFLRATFLDMFGDPVSNPMGWNNCKIEDLCKTIVDCPHTTPQYCDPTEGIPCIRTSDLQKGFLEFETTKYVTPENYAVRIKRHEPSSGDIVYSREGERFGIAALIPQETKLCLGQRMMLFSPDRSKCTSEFLWGLLNSKGIYQQALKEVGGATSPHVNVGAIKKFKAIIPSMGMQRDYSDAIKKMYYLRNKSIDKLSTADTLFASLSQRAFRGEL